MRFFLELIRPTPETTVVDVGVADAPFGVGEGQALTHNFFEALYPWPERITAVGNVPLENFARALWMLGALVFLVGIGLVISGFLHHRRSRGPRRNLPKGPRGKLPSAPKPPVIR